MVGQKFTTVTRMWGLEGILVEENGTGGGGIRRIFGWRK